MEGAAIFQNQVILLESDGSPITDSNKALHGRTWQHLFH